MGDFQSGRMLLNFVWKSDLSALQNPLDRHIRSGVFGFLIKEFFNCYHVDLCPVDGNIRFSYCMELNNNVETMSVLLDTLLPDSSGIISMMLLVTFLKRSSFNVTLSRLPFSC